MRKVVNTGGKRLEQFPIGLYRESLKSFLDEALGDGVPTKSEWQFLFRP